MVAYSGNLVLLKVKQYKTYEVVGGMRTTRFLLNNQIIDATHKESGKWRELLSEVGVTSVSITGSGIFTNKTSESIVRNIAFKNQKSKFLLTFGNGDQIRGEFIVSTYERAGNVSEEETYNISLESAGEVRYISVSTTPVATRTNNGS
jgi:TP901-1 family phage major tail protein